VPPLGSGSGGGGGHHHPCTSQPQPCPSHPGVTWCPSDKAAGQCSQPMPRKPCPPCPTPSPPPAKPPALNRNVVFFTWNRAHFGAVSALLPLLYTSVCLIARRCTLRSG
jgi:hypothetical protein